jgi:hypothetical protein
MKRLKVFLCLLFVLMLGTAVVYAHTRDDAPVKYNLTVEEGSALTQVISCYDPDGDPVTIVGEDVPSGANISAAVLRTDGFTDPNLPPPPPEAAWYTSTLTWTPAHDQSGTYTIYIKANDDKGGEDWAQIIVTVTNKNRPPVL